MNDIATAKIRMMKASLCCLVFGLFGLMPVIGLPFALAALWVSGRARSQEKHFWNPARSCRIWGVVSAAIGAVIWSAVDIWLIFRAINGYVNS